MEGQVQVKKMVSVVKTLTHPLRDGTVMLKANKDGLKLYLQTTGAYCEIQLDESEVFGLADFFTKAKRELIEPWEIVDTYTPGD